ncbi:Receptor-interacting serine/threonine-protein kinase 3 [Blastocladiella emersonii ATCC 22665]|nr:Receptor-interacting serine/threonine-protein kinase 3 [Blastocladiella emersonii ATCC 22665]
MLATAAAGSASTRRAPPPPVRYEYSTPRATSLDLSPEQQQHHYYHSQRKQQHVPPSPTDSTAPLRQATVRLPALSPVPERGELAMTSQDHNQQQYQYQQQQPRQQSGGSTRKWAGIRPPPSLPRPRDRSTAGAAPDGTHHGTDVAAAHGGDAQGLGTLDRVLTHPALDAAKSLLRAVPFANIFVHLVDTLSRWRLLSGSPDSTRSPASNNSSPSNAHALSGNSARAASLAQRAHAVASTLLATIALLPANERRESHPRLRAFRDRAAELAQIQVALDALARHAHAMGTVNRMVHADHHARTLHLLDLALVQIERDIASQLALSAARGVATLHEHMDLALAEHAVALRRQLAGAGDAVAAALLPMLEAHRDTVVESVQWALMPGYLQDRAVAPCVRKLWWDYARWPSRIPLTLLIEHIPEFFAAEAESRAAADAAAAGGGGTSPRLPGTAFGGHAASNVMATYAASTAPSAHSHGRDGSWSDASSGGGTRKRDPAVTLAIWLAQTVLDPSAEGPTCALEDAVWQLGDLHLPAELSPQSLSASLAGVPLEDYIMWKLVGWLYLAVKLEQRVYALATPHARAGGGTSGGPEAVRGVFTYLGAHHIVRFVDDMQAAMNAVRRRFRYSQALHTRLRSAYARVYVAARVGATDGVPGTAGGWGFGDRFEDLLGLLEDASSFLQALAGQTSASAAAAALATGAAAGQHLINPALDVPFITEEAVLAFTATIRSMQVRLAACVSDMGVDLPLWTVEDVNSLKRLDAPMYNHLRQTRSLFCETSAAIQGDRLIMSPAAVTRIRPVAWAEHGPVPPGLAAKAHWCGHPVLLFRLDEEDEPAIQRAALASSIAYVPGLVQMHGLAPLAVDHAGDSAWYLVAEGVDLYPLAMQTLSVPDVLAVAQTLASALCVLQMHQVPHRTIGAHQVLVAESGMAKLAGLWDGTEPDIHGRYAPPEWRDEDEGWVDGEPVLGWIPGMVYAFGVLVWEMLLATCHGARVYVDPVPIHGDGGGGGLAVDAGEIERLLLAAHPQLLEPDADRIIALVEACVSPVPAARPTFAAIVNQLLDINELLRSLADMAVESAAAGAMAALPPPAVQRRSVDERAVHVPSASSTTDERARRMSGTATSAAQSSTFAEAHAAEMLYAPPTFGGHDAGAAATPTAHRPVSSAPVLHVDDNGSPRMTAAANGSSPQRFPGTFPAGGSQSPTASDGPVPLLPAIRSFSPLHDTYQRYGDGDGGGRYEDEENDSVTPTQADVTGYEPYGTGAAVSSVTALGSTVSGSWQTESVASHGGGGGASQPGSAPPLARWDSGKDVDGPVVAQQQQQLPRRITIKTPNQEQLDAARRPISPVVTSLPTSAAARFLGTPPGKQLSRAATAAKNKSPPLLRRIKDRFGLAGSGSGKSAGKADADAAAATGGEALKSSISSPVTIYGASPGQSSIELDPARRQSSAVPASLVPPQSPRSPTSDAAATTEAKLDEARALLRRGDAGEAAKILFPIANQGIVVAHLLLGDCYVRGGAPSGSLRQSATASTAFPRDVTRARLHYANGLGCGGALTAAANAGLGDCALVLAQPNAEAHYRAALAAGGDATAEDRVRAAAGLADALFAQGQFREALDNARTAAASAAELGGRLGDRGPAWIATCGKRAAARAALCSLQLYGPSEEVRAWLQAARAPLKAYAEAMAGWYAACNEGEEEARFRRLVAVYSELG